MWGEEPDGGEAVPAPVHYDDGSQDEPEELGDDGGVSDKERIVRVWVEDSRIVKVRVSPNWYAKLERRKPLTLAQVVTAVLQVAHVGVAAPRDVADEAPTVELTPEFKRLLPELSWTTLQRMDEHYEALFERFSGAGRAAEISTPPATVGRSKGVMLRLNRYGQADAVEFDERWLDSAQAGEISSQIMRAAEDAYARYVPTPDVDDSTREMAREFDYTRKVMYTILTPKERR